MVISSNQKIQTNKPHPKSKFTENEDCALKFLVSKLGEDNWNEIAFYMNGRTVRQCRERWKNYLNPLVNKDEWTEEEDRLLIEKYEEYGSKWKSISVFFQNRTDIMLKNRFLVIVRKENKRIRDHLKPIKSKRKNYISKIDIKHNDFSGDLTSPNAYLENDNLIYNDDLTCEGFSNSFNDEFLDWLQ